MDRMNEKKVFCALAAAFGIGAACSISLANIAWVGVSILGIGRILVKKETPVWKKTGLEWPMGLFALWSLVASNWSAGTGEI